MLKKADKDRLIKAMNETMGIITTACEIAKVSKWSFYKLYKTDENFKKEVDEIGETALDFAENSLLKQIKAGNTIATIFYLKTKGKKRGYIEKSELEHSGTIENKVTGFNYIVPEPPK